MPVLRDPRRSACFAVTVFAGALLLFLVQPLISKFILPWFGGSPTVWTVCMLFFQTMLFFGYGYAHLLASRLSMVGQAGVHAVLLVLAVAMLPITPAAAWKPAGGEDPTWHIVALLTASIGLPYLLLSATGPLLQSWYSRLPGEGSPYRLYAVSNLGSLLALLSYPFAVDRMLGATAQTTAWSWLFAGFAGLCVACASLSLRQGRAELLKPAAGSTVPTRPNWRHWSLWFALSMVPSVMLLAVTNQICMDVAVVPFLWILPLILYLLSFILCFQDLRWCPRNPWAVAWSGAVAVTLPVMFLGRAVTTSLPITAQVAVYGGLLFACAMCCHGELVRLKPAPCYLTSFYLTLAAGGAAGGLFVGVLAPQLFPVYIELSLAIIACILLLLWVYYRDPRSSLYQGRRRIAWLGLLAATLATVGALAALFQSGLAGVEIIHRNFYGVLQVRLESNHGRAREPVYQLIHGRTLHGLQYLTKEKSRWATSYYGPNSGIGLILQHHRAGQPRRVGLVGLGIGTLATYGQAGDRFRFYEINPAVVFLAERFFLYLHESPAVTETVPGDARISLDRELPQAFDVLVLDAFSSDAIPIHLLTAEAFEVYLRHLRPDGILAVHISNVHVDLRPVLSGHAHRLGLSEVTIHSSPDPARDVKAAVWTLLSRDPAALQIPELRREQIPPSARRLHWTDDRHSLLEVLRPPFTPHSG